MVMVEGEDKKSMHSSRQPSLDRMYAKMECEREDCIFSSSSDDDVCDGDGVDKNCEGTKRSPRKQKKIDTDKSKSMHGDHNHPVVALVSDFFLPHLGGVEAHIYEMAVRMARNGVKVVVITHEYSRHSGVIREGCLTIYYLPLPVMWRQNTYPTVLFSMPILRRVFLLEQVDLVHGHSSFSVLCHEALLLASMMNLKTVYTDHSMLDVSVPSNMIVSNLLAFTLSHSQHAIGVSHICREQLVVCAGIERDKTSVIPNAVDTATFFPVQERPITPTIVVMSRLFWRKGIDLLARVIPLVCEKHPTAVFLIGGDGPMRINLEEMREQHNLSDRVHMLGSVLHENVPRVLQRGSVFLNCSRTEAFCMAILEAACCGLDVVSTNVGGVPEVLPPSMCRLAPLQPEALACAVLDALEHPIDAHEAFSRYSKLCKKYSWDDVTSKTLAVYSSITEKPVRGIWHLETWKSLPLVFLPLFVPLLFAAQLLLLILGVFQPGSRYRRKSK
eukprot:m.89248 g.89248  ORF g.89248 m.89248 type:complete len:500 (+) comp8828_c0_seq4:43-1542(+)